MDPARHRNYETILPLIYGEGDGEEALKWSKEQITTGHCRYLEYMAAIYDHAGNDEMAISLDAFLAQRKITTLSDYEKVVPTICKDFRRVSKGRIARGLIAATLTAILMMDRMLHFLQWVGVFLALSRTPSCNLLLCAGVRCTRWPAKGWGSCPSL